MEPFALHCTTCKSRLKVRDAAAIGQIMACPKCGGMVLVKAPPPGIPGNQSGSAGSSSSGALSPAPIAIDTGETKADLSQPLRPPAPVIPANYPLDTHAFDDVDALLGNVPSSKMVPTPTFRPNPTSPHTKPQHLPPPPPLGQSIIKPAEQRTSPDSQAKTISQNDIAVAKPALGTPALQPATKPAEIPQKPAAVAAAVTVPAAVIATSANSDLAASPAPRPPLPPQAGLIGGSPWQYWAMVSASGVLGVLLAVGVVVLTISWVQAPRPTIAQPVPPATDPQQPPVVAPLPPVPGTASPAENPGGNNPSAENPLVTPISPAPPKDPPLEVEPVSPPPVAPPMPLPPERDPLGLTDPPPADVKPMIPADDPLKRSLEQFLGGPAGAGPSDPPPAEPAPLRPMAPPSEEDPGPSPTAPALPKPQPRVVDVAARLADPLPAIDVSGSPLADFLQVMQDLSTVPITLRPDGLKMIKLTPFSPDTPVAWKGAATTVGDALQGALAPLGLEARIEADQLIVDVASSQLSNYKLDVQELTNSDEQRTAELSLLMMNLVAPDSWGDEEGQPTIGLGKGELTIKQNRLALAQCILLAEKLRVARGLRPASRFDPKLFELTTRAEQAQAALATPITLNYSIPTPLVRITDRLGKTANVRILIDWQSLSAVGWNPAAEATLSVDKKSLAATLTDLTTRMELSWRIVDARTVQILSPQALADMTELEVYPIAKLAANEAAGQALVAKIRAELGGQNFRDAGGRSELRFDAGGKCLLASLTPPQHQQLAALLRSLQPPAK